MVVLNLSWSHFRLNLLLLVWTILNNVTRKISFVSRNFLVLSRAYLRQAERNNKNDVVRGQVRPDTAK